MGFGLPRAAPSADLAPPCSSAARQVPRQVARGGEKSTGLTAKTQGVCLGRSAMHSSLLLESPVPMWVSVPWSEEGGGGPEEAERPGAQSWEGTTLPLGS